MMSLDFPPPPPVTRDNAWFRLMIAGWLRSSDVFCLVRRSFGPVDSDSTDFSFAASTVFSFESSSLTAESRSDSSGDCFSTSFGVFDRLSSSSFNDTVVRLYPLRWTPSELTRMPGGGLEWNVRIPLEWLCRDSRRTEDLAEETRTRPELCIIMKVVLGMIKI